MITLVNFKAEHMEQLTEQEATAYLKPYVSAEHVKALETASHSYTGIASGRTIFCAGVIPLDRHRGMAWAVIDQDCKKYFIGIHNTVRRFLEVCPYQRVEATVDADFTAGHRWVKTLGFQLEAPRMRAFNPDGGDCALYARVR